MTDSSQVGVTHQLNSNISPDVVFRLIKHVTYNFINKSITQRHTTPLQELPLTTVGVGQGLFPL